jgi:hypothetical protein
VIDNVNGMKVPRYLIYDIVVYEVCEMNSRKYLFLFSFCFLE